jgi:hypothetical protein
VGQTVNTEIGDFKMARVYDKMCSPRESQAHGDIQVEKMEREEIGFQVGRFRIVMTRKELNELKKQLSTI